MSDKLFDDGGKILRFGSVDSPQLLREREGLKRPKIFLMDADGFALVSSMTWKDIEEFGKSLETFASPNSLNTYTVLSTQRAIDFVTINRHKLLFPLRWDLEGRGVYSPGLFEKGLVLARVRVAGQKYEPLEHQIKTYNHFLENGEFLQIDVAYSHSAFEYATRIRPIIAEAILSSEFFKKIFGHVIDKTMVNFEDGKEVELSLEVGKRVPKLLRVQDDTQAKLLVASEAAKIIKRLGFVRFAKVIIAGDVDIIPTISEVGGKDQAIDALSALVRNDPLLSKLFPDIKDSDFIVGDDSFINLAKSLAVRLGTGYIFSNSNDKETWTRLFAKLIDMPQVTPGDVQSFRNAIEYIRGKKETSDDKPNPHVKDLDITDIRQLLRK